MIHRLLWLNVYSACTSRQFNSFPPLCQLSSHVDVVSRRHTKQLGKDKSGDLWLIDSSLNIFILYLFESLHPWQRTPCLNPSTFVTRSKSRQTLCRLDSLKILVDRTSSTDNHSHTRVEILHTPS